MLNQQVAAGSEEVANELLIRLLVLLGATSQMRKIKNDKVKTKRHRYFCRGTAALLRVLRIRLLQRRLQVRPINAVQNRRSKNRQSRQIAERARKGEGLCV